LWFTAPAPEGTGGASGGTSEGTGASTGSGDTKKTSEDDKGRAGGQEALQADLAAERARRHEAETSRDDFKSQLEKFLKALTGGKPAEDLQEDPIAKIGELQRQVEERENRAKTQLIRAEVKSIANRLGFHDPADAMSQIDLSNVKVNDDGEADSQAIEAKLKEVAQKKPYLLKVRDDASASDVGIGSGSRSSATPPEGVSGKERIAAGHRAKAAQRK
jgi:hypothetical protein